MKHPLRRRVIAESFGTFWLVFAGTGAIVVGSTTGSIPHAAVAFTFALVVFTMIAALGDISGAHLNPAVTIGLYLARRIPAKDIAPYISGQLAGALCASMAILALFPGSDSLGATAPQGSFTQSWLLEVTITMGLMFVILSVTATARSQRSVAAMAIGGAVGLGAMIAGPVSGGSMNPARSLAPALVSGNAEHLLLYITAPIVGAALAVLACVCIRDSDCCKPNAEHPQPCRNQ